MCVVVGLALTATPGRQAAAVPSQKRVYVYHQHKRSPADPNLDLTSALTTNFGGFRSSATLPDFGYGSGFPSTAAGFGFDDTTNGFGTSAALLHLSHPFSASAFGPGFDSIGYPFSQSTLNQLQLKTASASGSSPSLPVSIRYSPEVANAGLHQPRITGLSATESVKPTAQWAVPPQQTRPSEQRIPVESFNTAPAASDPLQQSYSGAASVPQRQTYAIYAPLQQSYPASASVSQQQSYPAAISAPQQQSYPATVSVLLQQPYAVAESIPQKQSYSPSESVPQQQSYSSSGSIPQQQSYLTAASTPSQQSYPNAVKDFRISALQPPAANGLSGPLIASETRSIPDLTLELRPPPYTAPASSVDYRQNVNVPSPPASSYPSADSNNKNNNYPDNDVGLSPAPAAGTFGPNHIFSASTDGPLPGNTNDFLAAGLNAKPDQTPTNTYYTIPVPVSGGSNSASNNVPNYYSVPSTSYSLTSTANSEYAGSTSALPAASIPSIGTDRGVPTANPAGGSRPSYQDPNSIPSVSYTSSNSISAYSYSDSNSIQSSSYTIPGSQISGNSYSDYKLNPQNFYIDSNSISPNSKRESSTDKPRLS